MIACSFQAATTANSGRKKHRLVACLFFVGGTCGLHKEIAVRRHKYFEMSIKYNQKLVIIACQICPHTNYPNSLLSYHTQISQNECHQSYYCTVA